MKKPTPWIICHDGTKGQDAYALECLRCGEKQRVVSPIRLDFYIAMAEAFGRIHGKCRPSREAKP
jgi:hypothetical protein